MHIYTYVLCIYHDQEPGCGDPRALDPRPGQGHHPHRGDCQECPPPGPGAG